MFDCSNNSGLFQSAILAAALLTATYELAASPPERIKVWVNAFIPRQISGLTHTLSEGSHKGETVIYAPARALNGCFLTDQRDFSGEITASARMHSEFSVTVATQQFEQNHRCGETIEVDCEDGDVECKQTASTKDMAFRVVKEESTAEVLVVKMVCGANNPCFTGSPDIEYEGTFHVRLDSGAVSFQGKIEPFPAFEGYVQYDDGQPKTLFRAAIMKGKTPKNLFGAPNVMIKGVVSPD